MGGSIDGNLKSSATHLIANSSISLKYYVARHKLAIKIVKPQWALDCWKYNKLLPEDDYLVQPMEGVRVCVTGILPNERERVKTLTEKKGGIFLSSLDLSCTHLICGSPGKGQKFKFALKSNIPIVSIDWFNESIECDGNVSETPYILTPPPTKDNSKNKNSKNNNVVDPNNNSTENHEKETQENNEDDVSFFFSACRIYLLGFPSQSEEKLTNLITKSGGKTVTNIRSHITHIIVKEVDQ